MDSRQPERDVTAQQSATIVDLGDNATASMGRVGSSRWLPLAAIGALVLAAVLTLAGLLGRISPPAPTAEPSAPPASGSPAPIAIGPTTAPEGPAWAWHEAIYEDADQSVRSAFPLEQTNGGMWALPDRFIALASRAIRGPSQPLALIVSTDGRAWSPLTLPFDGDIHAAAQEEGQFVVFADVASADREQHLEAWATPDGTEWDRLFTVSGLPPSPARIAAVAPGPTGWVAVVTSPVVTPYAVMAAASLWRSADGRIWRPVDLPALDSLGRIIGLAGSASRWVLVMRRDAAIEGWVSVAVHSEDGRDWTQTTMATTLGGPQALAARPEGFAAVGGRNGSSATAGVWLSADATQWRSPTVRLTVAPLTPGWLTTVAPWRAGWAAASESGDVVASADGETWLTRHVLVGGSQVDVHAIATRGNLVVAGGLTWDGEPRFWWGSLESFLP